MKLLLQDLLVLLWLMLFCELEQLQFMDIDKDTLGMSAESLVSKITNRTKVVVAQHSFGIPCKIDKIKGDC